MERVPLVLAVSPFPRLFAIHLFTARRQLVVLRLSVLPPLFGSMPLLLFLQDGAVWQKVSDAPENLNRSSLLVCPAACTAMPRPAAG